MRSSLQVVDDLLMRPRFFAIDEHLHLALLSTDDHGLLAHSPHHVEGAAGLSS